MCQLDHVLGRGEGVERYAGVGVPDTGEERKGKEKEISWVAERRRKGRKDGTEGRKEDRRAREREGGRDERRYECRR